MPLPFADWIVEHLMHVEPIQGAGNFGISKHIVAMMLASVFLMAVFIPFGLRIRRDLAPRGPLVNGLEAVLLFFRDDICRPILGKEGDKYLPFIWTVFFFILFNNLMGLLPLPFKVPVVGADGNAHSVWFGTVTPTGQIAVTGTLAVICAIWYHGLGIHAQGFVAYIRHFCPSGVPAPMVPFLWLIEAAGHLIKTAALMIRLWANMLGGHAVLFAFIGFIFSFGLPAAAVSIPAGVAIYFLEIFVSFLQAFVFTFLVVIFLGGALHPH